jgi:hypothetical protein
VAAVLTIQKVVSGGSPSGLNVIMGIDNTAAAAAVRGQYSSNEIVIENPADLLPQQRIGGPAQPERSRRWTVPRHGTG